MKPRGWFLIVSTAGALALSVASSAPVSAQTMGEYGGTMSAGATQESSFDNAVDNAVDHATENAGSAASGDSFDSASGDSSDQLNSNDNDSSNPGAGDAFQESDPFKDSASN